MDYNAQMMPKGGGARNGGKQANLYLPRLHQFQILMCHEASKFVSI